MDVATGPIAGRSSRMWPGRMLRAPSTSRGRRRHLVALLVPPDRIALEVAIVRAVFGRPVGAIADAMGLSGDSPYEFVVCGETTRVAPAAGIDLGELAPLETLTDADTVVVPGVADPLSDRSEALLDALRAAHGGGARMVSLCSGAFVLGQAGILDDRRATTHWLLAPEFRARFPRVRLDVDRLYVDDDGVHTSGGMLAAMDLALHLVALDCGQPAANDASRIMVGAPHRSGGQAQFVKDGMRRSDPTAVDELLEWLRDHLAERLTLRRVAAHQHVSERTLVRRFRAATGTTLYEWIIGERVNRAKELLETTDHPVGRVAALAGFGSAEGLRRHFEKSVGVTAGAYRRTFANGESTGAPADRSRRL